MPSVREERCRETSVRGEIPAIGGGSDMEEQSLDEALTKAIEAQRPTYEADEDGEPPCFIATIEVKLAAKSAAEASQEAESVAASCKTLAVDAQWVSIRPGRTFDDDLASEVELMVHPPRSDK